MKNAVRNIVLRTVIIEKAPFLVCLKNTGTIKFPIFVKHCDIDDIINWCELRSITINSVEFKRLLKQRCDYYVITSLGSYQGHLLPKNQFIKYDKNIKCK